MVGCWIFNEGCGKIVNNLAYVANINNGIGTINGTPRFSYASAIGDHAPALNFTGSVNFVDIGVTALPNYLNLPLNLTIMACVVPTKHSIITRNLY